MRARYKIALPVALYIALLVLLDSDRAVLVVFLALVATCSTLAGRELGRAIAPRVAAIVAAIVWGSIAGLYASGLIAREPGYSGYLVYLAVLMAGVIIPLSAVVESWRRRRSTHEE